MTGIKRREKRVVRNFPISSSRAVAYRLYVTMRCVTLRNPHINCHSSITRFPLIKCRSSDYNRDFLPARNCQRYVKGWKATKGEIRGSPFARERKREREYVNVALTSALPPLCFNYQIFAIITSVSTSLDE